MQAVFRNINFFLQESKIDTVYKSLLSPTVLSIFDFIRKTSLDDEQTAQRIMAATKKINNGSHNLLAVEIFARGMENIPMRFMPVPNGATLAAIGGIDSIKVAKSGGPELGTIVGLANSTDVVKTFLKLFHTTKAGYKDADGIAAKKDNENFDLKVMKQIDKKLTRSDWDRERLVRGREIKLMGGLVSKKAYREWWTAYRAWQVANEPKATRPVLTYLEPKFSVFKSVKE